jgi:divalent metal cation (Fe/Co/Zn/Cd) transporter
VVDRARQVATSVPGVINTEKAAGRTSGTHIWLDLHIRVDPAMTVREAHAVSHQVKDAIRAAIPRVADVLVHIEPAEGPAAARRAVT